MSRREKNQPALRLVVDNEARRRYAQSTSGRSDSHFNFPTVSRSRATASGTEQERVPYATLPRCPADVSHLSARETRSRGDSDRQSSRSVMTHYHHTVLQKATPPVEFTGRCKSGHNEFMGNPIAEVRRRNLIRLMDRDFRGNRSEIARVYDPDNPKPQYFSDLARSNSGKSFGEKVARKLEERVGLQIGQLDIPNSALVFDESRLKRATHELRSAIEDLDHDEELQALAAVRRIQAKRRRRA